MVLFEVNYFSNTLGINTKLNVLLPQQKSNEIDSKESIINDEQPVIYLLHGMGNDESVWMRRTSIERYASQYGFAVVIPTTQLGCYTDTAYGAKYWTYISEELPQFCKEYFNNFSDKKEDTFVAGVSMGGHGALKLALTHPENFKAAASLSGPLNIASESITEGFKNKRKPFWEGVFGPLESIKGSKNDLIYLLDSLAKNNKIHDIPKIYSWCGTEDFLYKNNLEMEDKMKSLKVDCNFNYSEGEHNWSCWDREIQNVLKWFSELRNK